MSSAVSACAAMPPAGTVPPCRSWIRCHSARHALLTAQPHDEVPVDPPATLAAGRSESPMLIVTCCGDTPSSSAASTRVMRPLATLDCTAHA